MSSSAVYIHGINVLHIRQIRSCRWPTRKAFRRTKITRIFRPDENRQRIEGSVRVVRLQLSTKPCVYVPEVFRGIGSPSVSERPLFVRAPAFAPNHSQSNKKRIRYPFHRWMRDARNKQSGSADRKESKETHSTSSSKAPLTRF